ncbi:hypothetical protein JXQ70_14080 [bacterium]|nr:hypothetical protein [bacterium]
MNEESTTPKIELSEVMLAMDVVDTLRHQQSLVERELQSEEREAELIAKLRTIYADQGLEVTDEVIAEGVKALREERFAYRPPAPGLKTTLARLYVNRGRWAKRASVLLAVLLGFGLVHHFLFVVPAERKLDALSRQTIKQVTGQLEQIAGLKDQITTVTGELEKAVQLAPAAIQSAIHKKAEQTRQNLEATGQQLDLAARLESLKKITSGTMKEDGDRIRKAVSERQGVLERAQSTLEETRDTTRTIRSLIERLNGLESLRADAVEAAREKRVSEQIHDLYNNAFTAVKKGDFEAADAACQALENIRDQLTQEYTVQIVSRPGSSSGAWRTTVDNPNVRNYYLIVEAISASGQRLELPIISEEDGQTLRVTEWGLRVERNVFEQVRRDKEADGIVNNKIVGSKKRGYLSPDYTIATTGGTITSW